MLLRGVQYLCVQGISLWSAHLPGCVPPNLLHGPRSTLTKVRISVCYWCCFDRKAETQQLSATVKKINFILSRPRPGDIQGPVQGRCWCSHHLPTQRCELCFPRAGSAGTDTPAVCDALLWVARGQQQSRATAASPAPRAPGRATGRENICCCLCPREKGKGELRQP